MNKYILIIFYIYPFYLMSQPVPLFESTLFFEDALGNKDTIVVGYDSLANNTFNPEFGEIDDQSLMDSIFEVRAVHDAVFHFISGGNRSKKIYSGTIALGGNWSCRLRGVGVGFIVHIKYPPLKIKWRKEDYLDVCRVNSYATNVIDGLLPPSPWEGYEDERSCLGELDSFVIDFSKQTSPYEKILDIEEVEGGELDTIWGVNWAFLPQGSGFSPCYHITSTKPPAIKKQNLFLTTYPNPIVDELSIVLENKVSDNIHLKLFDVNGQLVFTREETAFLEKTISLKEIPSGIYFLEISTKNGLSIGIQKVIIL